MIARHHVAERMDSPTLAPAAHEEALRGLERINRVSGAVRPFLRPILSLAETFPHRPLRLLDVACGAADVPLAIADTARRMGREIDLTLLDQSDTVLAHAHRQAVEQGHQVRLMKGNAIRDLPDDGFDVVTCSLFLHHLMADDVVIALRQMRRVAQSLILVSDLRRALFGLAVAQVGVRVLSRSEIVHFDGPASVRGAWTIEEMAHLAGEAGLSEARITRQWPWRMFLQWSRHD